MMHAKTAVADGLWARVGSTNLNIASWIGNYELDVAIEDAGFARSMEDMFLADLENSTEVVLRRPNRVGLAGKRPRSRPPLGDRNARRGRMRRAGAGTLRIGYTVGAALSEHRLLGHGEAKITGAAGLLCLITALAGLLWPRVLSLPLAVFGAWLALALLIRTYRLYFAQKNPGKRPGDGKNGPC